MLRHKKRNSKCRGKHKDQKGENRAHRTKRPIKEKRGFQKGSPLFHIKTKVLLLGETGTAAGTKREKGGREPGLGGKDSGRNHNGRGEAEFRRLTAPKESMKGVRDMWLFRRKKNKKMQEV